MLDKVKDAITHSLFNGDHKISLTSGGIASISKALISHAAPNVNVSGGNHNIDSITNISKLLKTSSISQLTNYIKF